MFAKAKGFNGTIMSKKEAEAMLTGQDPNAGPRGDQYKASFDTSLLQGVGADDDTTEGTDTEKREYIAAEKFQGAREGFVFTTGAQGLGTTQILARTLWVRLDCRAPTSWHGRRERPRIAIAHL